MSDSQRPTVDLEARAIIFDLDGTLIDTYDTHRTAWRDACREAGIELTDEMFAWSFGRNNPTIIERLWTDAGRPCPTPEEMEHIAEKKEDDFRATLLHDRPVMPGVPDFCRRMASQGWLLGIGTSAPKGNLDAARRVLDLDDCITAAATGDELTRGKPDPEVFQLVASRLGVLPRRCVVIEDAPAGIDAAIAGDMTAIGIASTGRTPQELSHASLVVASFEELDDRTMNEFVPLTD